MGEQCAEHHQRQETRARVQEENKRMEGAKSILELRLEVNEANRVLIDKRKLQRSKQQRTVLKLVGGTAHNGHKQLQRPGSNQHDESGIIDQELGIQHDDSDGLDDQARLDAVWE